MAVSSSSLWTTFRRNKDTFQMAVLYYYKAVNRYLLVKELTFVFPKTQILNFFLFLKCVPLSQYVLKSLHLPGDSFLTTNGIELRTGHLPIPGCMQPLTVWCGVENRPQASRWDNFVLSFGLKAMGGVRLRLDSLCTNVYACCFHQRICLLPVPVSPPLLPERAHNLANWVNSLIIIFSWQSWLAKQSLSPGFFNQAC